MSALGTPGKKPRLDGGWTRRRFISTAAKAVGAAATFIPIASSFAAVQNPSAPARSDRKRIAILATEVRRYTHPQHFIDRFLEGCGWQGQHHRPPIDLASLYLDQFPEGEFSRERERRRGVKIYPSLEEALTLGGSNQPIDRDPGAEYFVLSVVDAKIDSSEQFEHGLRPRRESAGRRSADIPVGRWGGFPASRLFARQE